MKRLILNQEGLSELEVLQVWGGILSIRQAGYINVPDC